MCFTQNFWSLLVSGLADGFLYALIALGYTLVYGVLQLINFAHSEVFMMGGFASYFALNALIGTSTPHGLASVGYVVIGIVVGAAGGGLLAFLLERVAYRPLRKRTRPASPSSSAPSGPPTSSSTSPARSSGATPTPSPPRST